MVRGFGCGKLAGMKTYFFLDNCPSSDFHGHADYQISHDMLEYHRHKHRYMTGARFLGPQA